RVAFTPQIDLREVIVVAGEDERITITFTPLTGNIGSYIMSNPPAVGFFVRIQEPDGTLWEIGIALQEGVTQTAVTRNGQAATGASVMVGMPDTRLVLRATGLPPLPSGSRAGAILFSTPPSGPSLCLALGLGTNNNQPQVLIR